MVGKNILIGNFKPKCINVVRTEPLCNGSKSYVEVTFDGLVKERNSVAYVLSDGSFGHHLKDPYPHFLTNSTIDCEIQEEDVRKLNGITENDSIIMDNGNGAFNPRFGIGWVDNELEFEVSSKPFKNLFKFMHSVGAQAEPMGSCKTKFEIVKSVLPEFIIRDKYYLTYASFGDQS